MRLFDPGPVVVRQEEPKPSGPVCLDLRTYPDEVCVPEWKIGGLRACKRCGFPA